MKNKLLTLYEFATPREARTPIPKHAEHMLKSSFSTQKLMPSKYALGRVHHEYVFTCPSCGQEMPEPDHGSRVQCGCGLIMETYGNSLVIWREESEIQTMGVTLQ